MQQRLLFFLVAFLRLHATGPFPVRLSGGPSLCAGRVELFLQGEWGTVCDDSWDLQDAAVVCRELDCGAALSAPHGAWFGEGPGPIWLNEVRCLGTEEYLHSCPHIGFRKHVCTHEEDASAICSAQPFAPLTAFPPQPDFRWGQMKAAPTARPFISSAPAEGTPALRLVDGRSRCSGRLEVFHEGEWGTVCDDMWDLLDVAVVCRELDCGEALAAPGSAFFGEGRSVIWLDDVQCQGEESMLSECRTSLWGTTNCRHSEDAGAVCSGEMPLAMVEEHVAMLTRTLAPQRRRYMAPKRIPRPTQPTGNQEATVVNEALQIEKSQKEAVPDGQWQVRLQGGPGSCAGRVEILYQNHWGTVCDDGWDLVDAAVVCRELGCGPPLLSPGNARYGPGSGPIWLDDVNCTGAEFTLQNCRSQPWGTHNCNHHEDASVICTGRWKRLSLPDSSSNSKIAAPPATTMNPGQSILDVAETSPTPQEFSASWELEFPEAPFLTTQTVELELEKEQKQASPFNIIETIPNPETLQYIQEMESRNTPKIEPSTQKWGQEPVYASVESLPASPTLELVSEREAETISLWNMDKATPNLEILQHVQGTESASTPTTRPQMHKLEQPPAPSTAEFQPTLAMQELESEKETESTSPTGTGLPTVAPGLTLATEVVQSEHRDIAFKAPSVQKVELTYPTATDQPTTSASVQEPDRVNVIDHVVKELFLFSKILKAAREMEVSAATQNAQSVNYMDSINHKSSHSEENADQKQQEESNTYPHTMGPTEPTIAPIVLTSLAETDVHDTTVLLQSTVSHTVSMDGLLQDSLVSSGNTERGAGTTSAPGLIEAPGPNTTLTESVTHSATVSETSSDWPFRQDSRGKDQGCCCSPPGLENLAHAMTSLRGELGSLSTAIQHQGSQLQAVARSLAELAASVNHLVGVLPALLKPAAAQSSSAQNTQNEGQMHNQLPLK
ncbi:soluble scavenger receptor cysteine-rich domain-containing protein SSC5D isoform X2 [Zootoca vivipara]|uniref:soluble scavenger receptor cysteine-rich domain-containing protein SSC5D isoform X2 n=1 Tax=Zootoca vivipara TaxID=8524 RepID=UPI00293B9C33|nr:soluble scavenger receptor cysteine-rich domain-containing protein SSC5D isoform X2 [Zootoca vivipara]